MHQKKLTIPDLRNRKNGTPIAEITAYDYPWAKAADAAGIDVMLVGDSLGKVVMGYPGHGLGDHGRDDPPHQSRWCAVSNAPW
jgi:Ketopantoate hydroxymethyltransferase